MSEHDQHRQRVYRRFLNEGLMGFEEHNALELLLFLAKSRGDTTDTARALLKRFGSVAKVLDASVEELQQVDGVGPSSAVALKMIPEMCAYYLRSKNGKAKRLDGVDVVLEYLQPYFFAQTVECCYALFLDDRRKLLRTVQISEGIGNATSVSIAKIIAEATSSHATGVILAHNHPSGIALPSSEDLALTTGVYQGLKYIHVELIDHIIFTTNDYLSFAQTEYLNNIKSFR